MTITFFVNGFTKPADISWWKHLVKLHAVRAMNGKSIIQDEVKLTLLISIPGPDVNPRLITLAHGIEDALAGIIYRDVDQIAVENIIKHCSWRNGIVVQVEPMPKSNMSLPALVFFASIPSVTLMQFASLAQKQDKL